MLANTSSLEAHSMTRIVELSMMNSWWKIVVWQYRETQQGWQAFFESPTIAVTRLSF